MVGVTLLGGAGETPVEDAGALMAEFRLELGALIDKYGVKREHIINADQTGLEFEAKTCIRICGANFVDTMAINYRKLGVDSKVLATALCKLLAQITQRHTKMNKIASVAHPLGSNQRRLIIQTHRHRSERHPD